MSEPIRKYKAFKVSFINEEGVLMKETLRSITTLNSRFRYLKAGIINKLEIELLPYQNMKIINVIINPGGKTANGFYKNGQVNYNSLFTISPFYEPEGTNLPLDKEELLLQLNFTSLEGMIFEAEILKDDSVRLIRKAEKHK